MNQYRLLHVKSVTYTKTHMDIQFDDCKINFDLGRHSKDFVDNLWASVFPGTVLMVKGRSGNEDHNFWGFDTIEDIKVVR